MVYSTYQSEIEQLDAQIELLRKQSNLCLFAKLLFFIASVFGVYFAVSHFTWLNLTGAIGCFVAYLAVCVADSKGQKKSDALKRRRSVCLHEMAYLDGDFSSFASGEEYVNPAHEYSFDLDLFGPSSLFNRINRCVTRRGSDRLAEKLTDLCQDKQTILHNQAAIVELAGSFHWRMKFMANKFIPDHLQRLSSLSSPNTGNGFFLRSVLPYLLIGLTALSFLLALFQFIGWHCFITFFLLNLGCSILFFRKILATNVSIGKLHQELVAYIEVLNDIQDAAFKSKVLVDLKQELFGPSANSLQAFGELSRLLNLFDQRGNVFIYVLFNGFALFDILLLKRIMQWEKKHLGQMDHWLCCVAEVDALVSLGTYSYNNPANVQAEILPEQDDRIIAATDIYHPFLAFKHAVPNHFTLGKKQVAIVTGANMAGKSTFLRTIGLNYILACNGVPVCATAFRFSIVTLFSSMRTTDNLSKDISYFNAELLRLKQLIQHVKSHPYTLIILDEILKGTNSKDKLEGSIVFLREIIRHHVSALIATHDLELAKLEEENGTVFCNYCFEIALSKDIEYTYRIARGVARNLNASFLLKNILDEMSSDESQT